MSLAFSSVVGKRYTDVAYNGLINEKRVNSNFHADQSDFFANKVVRLILGSYV